MAGRTPYKPDTDTGDTQVRIYALTPDVHTDVDRILYFTERTITEVARICLRLASAGFVDDIAATGPVFASFPATCNRDYPHRVVLTRVRVPKGDVDLCTVIADEVSNYGKEPLPSRVLSAAILWAVNTYGWVYIARALGLGIPLPAEFDGTPQPGKASRPPLAAAALWLAARRAYRATKLPLHESDVPKLLVPAMQWRDLPGSEPMTAEEAFTWLNNHGLVDVDDYDSSSWAPVHPAERQGF